MKIVSSCVMSGVVAALLPFGVRAIDLTVAAGSPQTLSASGTYKQVYLHDNLTIPTGITLGLEFEGGIWLPTSAGEDVTLLVEGTGRVNPESYSNYTYLLFGFGGGRGHYVWRGNSGQDRGLNMRVSSKIEADADGYANVVRAEKRMPLYCLRNEGATVPVRLTLADGAYLTSDSSEKMFRPNAGTTIDLHCENGPFMIGLNGRIDRYNSGVKNISLNSGEGLVTTSGDGEFILWNSHGGTRGTVTLNVGTNQVHWAHRGDFVVTNNLDAVLSADYALPFGKQTGQVRVVADFSWQTGLDLAGHEAAVNGLEVDVAHGCVLKNSAATPARLVLGLGDTDGSLHAGKASGTVNVAKKGTGTLVVRDTEVADFSVDGGVVVVSNGTLRCGTFAVTNALVRCVQGGKIVAATWAFGPGAFYAVPATANGVLASCRAPAENIGVYKDGAGLATCLASPAVSGVHVAEGTLRVGGTAYGNPYWRFTFKKSDGDVERTAGGESAVFNIGIGKLHVFDLSGNIANYWMGEDAVGTEATALGQNRISSARPYVKMTSEKNSPDYSPLAGSGIWNTPANLTYDLARNYYRGLAYTNGTLSVENPSSWEVLTLRLNPGQMIGGYLMSQLAPGVYGCRPRVWSVETSPDGVTWEVADERAFSAPISAGDATYANGGVPYLFCAAKVRFAPSQPVRVDAGAVLDLDNLDAADISVSWLAVDCGVGGGSVTRFVPAEDGRIDLTVADETALPYKFKVLTAKELLHAERLPAWKVYCNGERMESWHVAVRGTDIRVSRMNGLKVIVQ